jgi:hypothetical protein
MANVDGFAEVVGGSVPARIWNTFMAPAVAPLPIARLPGPPSAPAPRGADPASAARPH